MLPMLLRIEQHESSPRSNTNEDRTDTEAVEVLVVGRESVLTLLGEESTYSTERRPYLLKAFWGFA